MSFQRLEYFITIAELGNYNKAAEKLFISQPALSASMHKLEESLDCELFVHKGRNAVLSEEGKLVYSYAKKMLRLTSECKTALAEMKNCSANQIRIGMPVYSNYNDYLHILTDFKVSNPEVVYSFVNQNSTELIKSLKVHEIDMAIMLDIPQVHDADIKFIPLRREQRCVFVSRMNPLSSCESLTIDEICGETLLFFSEDVYERYRQMFNSRGYELKTHKKMLTLPLILDLVAVNQGIFISFRNCITETEHIVAIPLIGDDYFSSTILAFPREGKMNDMVKKLKDFVRDCSQFKPAAVLHPQE